MIIPAGFFPSGEESSGEFDPDFNPEEFDIPPELTDSEELPPIRPLCEEFFAPGGPLRQAAARGGRPYEFRPQQIEMSGAIADALADGSNLCVEAPPGVGKSFAYLVPLSYRSRRRGRPAIISTETINLQEQLIDKDIPLLRELTGIEFRAALAKGRHNYLCRRRLSLLRGEERDALLPAPSLALDLDRIVKWLERGSDGDRGHQVGQEGHRVDVVGGLGPSALGHRVADHGAHGACEQRAAYGDEYRSAVGSPDGGVVQYSHLAVHAVFGDVLVRKPPLRRQVGRIARVQEAVVSRIGQEGLEGEGDDREDRGEEGQDYQQHGYDVLADLAQVDLRDLAGLSGDGGVVLAAPDAQLVGEHDRDAEEHHDDRQDAGLAGVLVVHGHVLGGQRGKVQVVRNGVASHRAAEDQQDRGEDGRLDHRDRDAQHRLPLRGVEDGRRLLEVGIHVAEDAADEDVGEGGVVQSEDHHAGEQSHAPPCRHHDAEGRQQSVGRACDCIGREHVLPDDREGPLGHDVGEYEDGAQVFPGLEVRPCDQEGEDASIEYRDGARTDRQPYRVEQRLPEVALRERRGEQVYVVGQRIAAAASGKVFVYRSGVYLDRVLHDCDYRRHCARREHYSHQQEDHVLRFGEERAHPVQHYPAGGG